jgi:O-antigen/teichoic acid export membrane protein
MGIVLKQSVNNTLILFLGFAIGGINTLFLYTNFLHEDYYGLIVFLLSTATIILPLLVFGMHSTVIKFFSAYKSKLEKDTFLSNTIILPLLIIIPLALIGTFTYDYISTWLSKENILIKDYTYLIFLSAVFMGYFEVFYSWAKVQYKSVFGNFVKEIFARICVTLLLFGVYFNLLSNEEFIYAVVIVYGVRMLIMAVYAVYVYKPQLIFKLSDNYKDILSFSAYIIVAGSAGGILLEIDKFMIPQIKEIAEVAYYSVGIYIASVVAIPTRAMQHITSPITAKEMNDKNIVEVEKLYKQTSINLLVVGGLFFLLINLNIEDLYVLINKPQFTKGIWIVLIISLAKMIELALGTGNAILVNSKYYKIFFYLSVLMALSVIVLNKILIVKLGINGAALTTLVVVLVYSIVKVIYIKSKLKIQPFKMQTVYLCLVISVLFFTFYYWNFNFHPIINIGIKSLLISGLYLFIIKKLKISKDLNTLFSSLVK